MCGIAGVIGPEPPSPGRIEAAFETMQNRGPDAQGHGNYTVGQNTVSLVHTRLSIIDLDPRANQPFEKDGLVLSYNGEIYNYLELRRELEGLGQTFSTASDTEVLLAAYRQWGAACLDKFEGMWAFALLDTAKRTLLLSRDRFGEKPLFIWEKNGSIYFASEVKTLAALAGEKPSVNDEQIFRYLVNGYKCLHKQPATYYEGVRELPPATFAEIPLEASPTLAPSLTPKSYWKLDHKPAQMTAKDALEGVRERLFRAVELRLRADVPLAFCLSGGIDSATLAAIAAKKFGHSIHCFSIIDDDERYDETENINTMVEWLGCDHHVTRTSRAGFFERMERLVAYHDAPVVTISYYVHSFLSEAISENGYKVAVSGTAADELFTGYYDHYSMWLAAMSKRAENDQNIDFDALIADWKGGLGAYVQNPLLQDPLAFAKDPGQRGHIMLDQDYFESLMAKPFHEDFSEHDYCPELLRNRMANELFHESVPIILEEDDRNSMMFSIENRSPYLDRELAEFMATVPSEHLIQGGFAKWLLRQTGDGLVPDSVRLDKRKRGFNASVNSLIDRDDPEIRGRLLADGPIFDYVRKDAIEEFLSADMTSNSFSKFLFSFVSASMFLEHHREWKP